MIKNFKGSLQFINEVNIPFFIWLFKGQYQMVEIGTSSLNDELI
jgi:hypothetical protein